MEVVSKQEMSKNKLRLIPININGVNTPGKWEKNGKNIISSRNRIWMLHAYKKPLFFLKKDLKYLEKKKESGGNIYKRGSET